jgi:hypothetical protein
MMAGGCSTPEAMAVLRQIVGTRVSPPTLSRWVDVGLVVPSVRKSRTSGMSHEWSPSDIVGLAWLLLARADGFPVSAYREALGTLWRRLPTLLEKPGALFFVVVGKDITVLTRAEIIKGLSVTIRQKMCIWPSPGSLAQVVAALAQLRPHGPSGLSKAGAG